MIIVAATHKYMDVRTQLKGESFSEIKQLNSKYWRDFEVIDNA